MFSVPDHPAIRNAERTGYGSGIVPKAPTCPVCDAECGFVYKNSDNEIVGCDICISMIESFEAEECFTEGDF